MIAMALALDPDILIADEPTTALDVTLQAQILKLLQSLQHRRNMAMILISHDLNIVKRCAQQVVVMNQGRVEEQGVPSKFLNSLRLNIPGIYWHIILVRRCHPPQAPNC